MRIRRNLKVLLASHNVRDKATHLKASPILSLMFFKVPS
jgi:hypothetical protein